MPSEVESLQYKDVRLFCDAKGVPDPRVYWTKNKLRRTISRKALLFLEAVDASDEGTYHCHATNRRGSSRVSAKVTVISKCSPCYGCISKSNALIMSIGAFY